MSCPNLAPVIMPSSHSRGDELSLEEYAQAVRAYQAVLLELQDVKVSDPDVLDLLLKKAAEAKESVNRYRGAHRQIS